jgi:hypothetical protein
MVFSETPSFRIGDIELGLSVKSNWDFAQFRRFPDFSSSRAPQVNYQIRVDSVPIQPTGPLIFDSGQSWRLYSNEGHNILWVDTVFAKPYLVGYFSLDYHSGEIYVSKSKDETGKYIFPLSYPLGELLMTCLLGTGYGIMLHSCGVIANGNGIVFAGTSTAGKSTTARLWDRQVGVHVLNDDHTIIRKINGQFRVYGTPWHGEGGIALADDAPLKQIFILKHAPANQVLRLSRAQSAAALLVRTFAALWSAPAMAFTLQFLDELCQAVPCYELGFVPDQSAVEFVRCLSSD